MGFGRLARLTLHDKTPLLFFLEAFMFEDRAAKGDNAVHKCSGVTHPKLRMFSLDRVHEGVDTLKDEIRLLVLCVGTLQKRPASDG